MLLTDFIIYAVLNKNNALLALVINIFSDTLLKGMQKGKKKRKVKKLKKDLSTFTIRFQKKYPGSILERDKWIEHLNNQRIIERIYEYALDPDKQTVTEKDYIRDLVENCKVMLALDSITVSITDEAILKEFYSGLLEKIKKFLQTTEGMELQAMLYAVNQVQLGNEKGLALLQKNYILNQAVYIQMEKRLAEVVQILKKQDPYIDDEWFLKQNHEAILNLGKRYLPDLNVTLEIQKNFDIIAADDHFFEYLKNEAEGLLLALFKISKDDPSLLHKRQEIMFILTEMNDFTDFVKTNSKLLHLIRECEEYAFFEYQKRVKEKKKDDSDFYQKQTLINRYWDVHLKADQFIQILNQKKLKMVETPFMLLYGEGGIGKSHLIADTVVKRNQEKKRSVLLLGQDFSEGCIIWKRFMDLMQFSSSIDAVLQTMNSFAGERQCRILIFIDAINEGGGKSVWKDKLGSLFDKFLSYPWLGLVITVRKDFLRVIFDQELIEKYGVTEIEHKGFGKLTNEAVQLFFEHYGISLKVMPYFPDEFSNPLFLRLFCEGYDKRRQNVALVSTEEIYRSYIDAENRKMADKFQYAEGINIVYEVIETFTLQSYGNHQRNRLNKETAVEIVETVALKHHVSSRIYEFLISEGILAEGISAWGEEYVFVTYERLADYIYASYLLQKIVNRTEPDEEIVDKINKPGVLEELNCILPEHGIELFERFPSLAKDGQMRNAFIAGILWRTDQGLIKKETKDYVEKIVVKNTDSCDVFYDNLIKIATYQNHPYNAKTFHRRLLKLSMAQRDAQFMELFNSWNEEGSSLNQLMQWCLQVAGKKTAADDESILLASMALSWILICTNNMLRDRVSITLCQLLRGHIPVMLKLLQSFQMVDDVYVLERLYGVAFGIVTFEQDREKIRELAVYIYQTVFDREQVLPDILIRDFAKQIICYAIKIVADSSIDMNKVMGPYGSIFPAIPDDKKIEQYRFDYEKENFQDYQWAQNMILESMQIDDHRGEYGDFGRYVFENYFRVWNDLSPKELMKVAIQNIFERGYDAEIHGKYDKSIGHSDPMVESETERIGKKYQWQALYRLAAEVSDNFPRYNEAFGNMEYNTGSYEPNLRKLDPTINILSDHQFYGNFPEIAQPKFDVPEQEWLKLKEDIPVFEKMVELKIEKDDYLLLSGWHNWKEETPFGVKEYDCPLKQMWFMVQAYIVKEEDYQQCIQLLKDENFWGRWMPEATANYSMYNREYYWSETQDYYDNEYYGGNEWKNLWRTDIEGLKDIMLMVPNYIYQTTGEMERLGLSYHSWRKPCRTLVQALKLKYHDENTAMYDEEGSLVCFDSCELFDKDIGLYFQKKALNRFLQDKNYRIFWTVLGEKTIIGGNIGLDKIYDAPEYTGLFYYDEKGRIVGNMTVTSEI